MRDSLVLHAKSTRFFAFFTPIIRKMWVLAVIRTMRNSDAGDATVGRARGGLRGHAASARGPHLSLRSDSCGAK